MPPSNSPVTDVTSDDIRCNVNGATGVPNKCVVSAGQTVTVEMHQQPGDRSCANEAIGGDHFGPLQVYLSKVSDATTADGSSGWFKIFEDTWSPVRMLAFSWIKDPLLINDFQLDRERVQLKARAITGAPKI